MSKYIIEFDYDLQRVVGVGVKQGTVWVKDYDVDDLEELCADYINEHFGDLQDEAYKRGVNDGSIDVKERVDGAYQKGFEDGKGAIHAGCEGCQNEGAKIFELPCSACRNAYPNKWTAKKQDDEIKVGDEIISDHGKAVVVNLKGDMCYYIYGTGGFGGKEKEKVTKTSRRFDIASILEAMG